MSDDLPGQARGVLPMMTSKVSNPDAGSWWRFTRRTNVRFPESHHRAAHGSPAMTAKTTATPAPTPEGSGTLFGATSLDLATKGYVEEEYSARGGV